MHFFQHEDVLWQGVREDNWWDQGPVEVPSLRAEHWARPQAASCFPLFFPFFLLFYFLFSVFLGKLFSSFLMLFFSLFSFFHRQVAFLFDFEEIEHTTVLGLTLQVIHINVLNIGHNFWSLGHSLEKPSPWYSFWRDWPHCDPSIIMFLSWHVVHQYGPH